MSLKMKMELSQKELNDLYYIVGSAIRIYKEEKDMEFLDLKVAENLMERFRENIYELSKLN